MSKSALELVVQLRTLAQDPNNRPHLIPAGDYVPPGLVMWLDHPSSDVVFNGKVLVFEFCAFARRFACPGAKQRLHQARQVRRESQGGLDAR